MPASTPRKAAPTTLPRGRSGPWLALRMVAGPVAVALLGSIGAAQAAERVAVAVYAGDPALKRYERTVQARLEEILADSGFEPLDEAKAKDLRDNWVDLANPGHLVTAEEIAAKAGRYDVKRIFRASFTAGSAMPLGLYHSASAQVQLRVIDAEARVKSNQSAPMGTRGFAGSDAATADAAMANALQRAVDSVAEGSALKVLAPASARSVSLVLEPLAQPPAAATPWPAAVAPARGWEKPAPLIEERWRSESVTCTATSADGGMGVVGTLVQHVDRMGGGGPSMGGGFGGRGGGAGGGGGGAGGGTMGGGSTAARTYGGYAHVLDLREKRPLLKLTVHEVGPRAAGENGNSGVIACSFLGAWRHLVLASGNRIACYDVERGRETCSLPVPGAADKAALNLLQAGAERYVEYKPEKGASSYFRIAAGR